MDTRNEDDLASTLFLLAIIGAILYVCILFFNRLNPCSWHYQEPIDESLNYAVMNALESDYIKRQELYMRLQLQLPIKSQYFKDCINDIKDVFPDEDPTHVCVMQANSVRIAEEGFKTESDTKKDNYRDFSVAFMYWALEAQDKQVTLDTATIDDIKNKNPFYKIIASNNPVEYISDNEYLLYMYTVQMQKQDHHSSLHTHNMVDQNQSDDIAQGLSEYVFFLEFNLDHLQKSFPYITGSNDHSIYNRLVTREDFMCKAQIKNLNVNLSFKPIYEYQITGIHRNVVSGVERYSAEIKEISLNDKNVSLQEYGEKMLAIINDDKKNQDLIQELVSTVSKKDSQ